MKTIMRSLFFIQGLLLLLTISTQPFTSAKSVDNTSGLSKAEDTSRKSYISAEFTGTTLAKHEDNLSQIAKINRYQFIENKEKAVVDSHKLAITFPYGQELFDVGYYLRIKWLEYGVDSIRIEYSTNLGVSWNIIINSTPSSVQPYTWILQDSIMPYVSSIGILLKISDVTDSSIFDVLKKPFTVWHIISNIQTPDTGLVHLNFGPTYCNLDMVVNNSAPITTTYYEFQEPLPGDPPKDYWRVGSYYWKIEAPNSIIFTDGHIRISKAKLRNLDNLTVVWMKRPVAGQPWIIIGAKENSNGELVSTIPFSSLSEFELGYYAPVPVELTSFSANVNNNIVCLKWSTSTELNNRGFEVQRKSSTYDYITVAIINGNGTKTTPSNYSWSEKLLPGTYSYRLGQVDYNGKCEYSKEVEITITPNIFSLEQNFPNPFNPSTVISYAIPLASNVKLIVYNTIGQTIKVLENGFKNAGNYSVKLNASNLPSGIYFYKLEAGQFRRVKKMILMK